MRERERKKSEGKEMVGPSTSRLIDDGEFTTTFSIFTALASDVQLNNLPTAGVRVQYYGVLKFR